jgi:iron(III) transport system ATP-binding protein
LLRRLVGRGRAPASIAARLTYQDVVHHYGDVTAVDGISLDVAPGETVCLLGPSGCGKTTMLRLAAGVEMPSGGRILLDGQDVTGGPTLTPPERRGVGLMFQDFALFPHLSNLDNVMFGLKALPRGDAEREARLALQRVGLGDYAESFPHMLSGGEQQRVALARAVAPRPGVLLMDEPFSGLDRRLRDEVREETRAVLRESRVTCVIVTHDPEEALRFADRIVLMRGGRIVQAGTPEDVYRHPADLFAARYFCELNEIEGTVEGGAVTTPLGRFAAPGLAAGTKVVVALRPQGIRLGAPGQGAPGKLLRRQFLGEVVLLDIAVQGLDEPVQARVRGALTSSADGVVGVAADPAEVLVFVGAEA